MASLSPAWALAASQVSDNGVVALNFSYTGFDDPLLDFALPVEFSVRYAASSGEIIRNETGACRLNFTQPENSVVWLNYSAETERYEGVVSFSGVQTNNAFRLSCEDVGNASHEIVFSDQSGPVTFLFDVYLPVIVDVFAENDLNGSGAEEFTVLTGRPQTFYIQVRNISDVGYGQNVTEANCSLTADGIDSTASFGGFGDYFLTSQILRRSGNLNFSATCSIGGTIYRSPTESLSVWPLFLSNDVVGGATDLGRQPLVLADNGSVSYFAYNIKDGTGRYTRLSRLHPLELSLLNFSHAPRNGALAFVDFWRNQSPLLLYFGELPNPSNLFGSAENNFADTPASYTALQGVKRPTLSVFDFDNDGDMDLILSGGKGETQRYTRLLLNNGSHLRETNVSVPDLQSATFCYGDFDQDFRYDLFVSGSDENGTLTAVYRNDGTDFVPSQSLLPALQKGACAVGSFLGNGRPNLLVFGTTESEMPSDWRYTVYADLENLSDTRVGLVPEFHGLIHGDVIVADFTNDGLSDFVICGGLPENSSLSLYVNDLPESGEFIRVHAFDADYEVPGCSLAASDYDFDGDADLALTGYGTASNPLVLFANQAATVRENSAPGSPDQIMGYWNASTRILEINWSDGSDAESAVDALSYNLEVRTQSGITLLSGQPAISSRPAQGYLGNMQYRHRYELSNVSNGDLVLRIQTIDTGLRKSKWREARIFTDTCSPSKSWTILNPTGCRLFSSLPSNSTIVIGNDSSLTLEGNLSLGDGTRVVVENGSIDLSGREISGAGAMVVVESAGRVFADGARFVGVNLSVASGATFRGVRFRESELSASAPVIVVDSTLEALQVGAVATLVNTTWESMEGPGTIDVRRYLSLTFLDQFGDEVTNVSCLDDSVPVACSSRLNLTGSWINMSGQFAPTHQLSFARSGFYNRTVLFNLTDNEVMALTLIRRPEPEVGIYSVMGLPSSSGDYASDLTAYSFVENVTIERPGVGAIRFMQPVNVSFLDLNAAVAIENGRIGIDSGLAPGLDRSASLSFENLSYVAAPVVLRDGQVCLDCSIVRFEGAEAEVTVSGFSNYTLTENSRLSLSSSSFLFNNTETDFSVSYTAYENSSRMIGGASCFADFGSGAITLAETASGYVALVSFNATGNLSARVTCEGNSSYEPRNQTYSLRVVRDGVYFIKGAEFPGLAYGFSVFGNLTNENGFWATGSTDVAQSAARALTITATGLELEASADGWGVLADFNNDGRTDLLLAGDVESGSSWRWYDNLAILHEIEAGLSGGGLIALDADFDGDTDILGCGTNSTGQPETVLLENRLAEEHYRGNVTFVPVEHDFPFLQDCSLAVGSHLGGYWLALAGRNANGTDDFGVFSLRREGTIRFQTLTGWQSSGLSLAFADANLDGFLDLVVSGRPEIGQYNTSIFEGNGTNLSYNQQWSAQLSQFGGANSRTSIAVGRITDASARSLIFSGLTEDGLKIQSYGFNGSDFLPQDVVDDVVATRSGPLLIGDVDGDSDLDLLAGGVSDAGVLAHLYANSLADLHGEDQRPIAPDEITGSYQAGVLALGWENGSDMETSEPLLSYNLRVGTTVDENYFLSGVRAASSRPVGSASGNSGGAKSANFSFPDACFRTQVQIVDAAYLASNWSHPNFVNQHAEVCNGYDNDCDALVDEDFLYPGTDLFIYNGTFNGTAFLCDFYANVAPERLSCPNSPTSAPGDACQSDVYTGASFVWNNATKRCDCDLSQAVLKNVRSNAGRSGGGVAVPASPADETENEPEPVVEVASISPPAGSGSSSAPALDGFDLSRRISYQGGRTYVTEHIRNIDRWEKQSVVVRKVFPKSVLHSARELLTINEYTIIEEDPVIDFELGRLAYLEESVLTYSIPGMFDAQELDLIQTGFSSHTAIPMSAIEAEETRRQEIAEQSIHFNLSETVEDNRTVISVAVGLHENVSQVNGIEIEQEIPKCLVEEITESVLESAIDPALLDHVAIKQSDPLLVWRFDRLDDVVDLKLTLDALRDADCEDEVRVELLARSFIYQNQPINWRSVATTLVVSIVLAGLALSPVVIGSRHRFEFGDPHVLRLMKLIRHQVQRGLTRDEVRSILLENQENSEQVGEAFSHEASYGISKSFTLLSEHRVELALFFILLGLSTLELAGMLPGYLDWFKKVLSWVIMLLVVYHANLGRLFFNRNAPGWSLSVMFGMFLMHLLHLAEFAAEGLGVSVGFVFDWYVLIVRAETEYHLSWIVFAAGLLLLGGAAAFAAWHFPARAL